MKVKFKGNSIIEHTDAIRAEFIELGKYQQNTRNAGCVAVDCSPDLTAAEQSAISDFGMALGCESVTVI